MNCLVITVQVWSAQLWQLIALQYLLGCCASFCVTVPLIAYCNAWFGERPATAIAITFAAFGLGGAVQSSLAAYIAVNFGGWRSAMATAAAAQWCVSLPLCVFAMRDPPKGAKPRTPS